MREVAIKQYMRPDGHIRIVHTDLEDTVADKATGMSLSSEVLTTGEIAVYARFDDEDTEAEHMELAENGPGDRDPNKMLSKCIEYVYNRRHHASRD